MTITDETEIININPFESGPEIKRFISFEPLLANVGNLVFSRLDWMIIGSLNKNGRPVSPKKGGTRKEWIESLINQAERYNIPVFIKPEVYILYPDLPIRNDIPYLRGGKRELAFKLQRKIDKLRGRKA